jgi:hypothetical protein
VPPNLNPFLIALQCPLNSRIKKFAPKKNIRQKNICFLKKMFLFLEPKIMP